MKKPFPPGGFKQICNILVNELKIISAKAFITGPKSFLSNIPEDYGKSSRLSDALAASFHLINHLYADTVNMKTTGENCENTTIRILAMGILKRIEKGTDLFEEIILILYKEKLLPEDELYTFETRYKHAMMLANVQIGRLVTGKFDSRNLNSIYKYALNSYDNLTKALNVLAESVRNKV